MRLLSDSTVVRRAMLLCLAALVLIFTGATLTAAEDLVQPDGRINQVAHFGGDAFYCVDENRVSTTNYGEMIDDGGFRLLDSNGQVLWFVPAADILAAIEESLETNTGVLVAEGQGTYGPVRLYTYFDGQTQQFVFSGYDEFGKPNSLMFSPCTPVGPIPDEPSSPETDEVELCILTVYGVPGPTGPQGPAKLVAPVKGVSQQILVPCDDCPTPEPPPIGAKLPAYKLAGGLVQGGEQYCDEGSPNDK